MESFCIYKDLATSQYKLKDNVTGNVVQSNANPTLIFNGAINTMYGLGGALCGVKNGVYEIDDNIFTNHFTGFVGESPEKTIIRAKSGFNDETLFRYWAGASSTPLQGFHLSNIKLELNVNNTTDAAWISSGMKDCHFDKVWVYSKKAPAISRIGFFMDTANNTNNNENVTVRNCKFEGSMLEQDMLGCGNLVNCDFSGNYFINQYAQAIGIGGSFNSKIQNNIFQNTGNAIGYEWYCENNLISGNLLNNTSGIKLSGGWNLNDINYSRNNKCVNNTFSYGDGGIEASVSVDDIISNNNFYRTERNGIQGSFLRCNIDNNSFIDMNWGNHSDRLIGNNQSQQTGGIIVYNSNNTVVMGNKKNDWNSFVDNYFINSGLQFTVPGVSGNKQSYMGGLSIDTNYKNSWVRDNRGSITSGNVVKNFGTKASFPTQ